MTEDEDFDDEDVEEQVELGEQPGKCFPADERKGNQVEEEDEDDETAEPRNHRQVIALRPGDRDNPGNQQQDHQPDADHEEELVPLVILFPAQFDDLNDWTHPMTSCRSL